MNILRVSVIMLWLSCAVMFTAAVIEIGAMP
ncbi:hypothetical protein SEA_BOILGATE_53 [Mycobacterium phage Boilgate]|nr:hypothetical protein SEA_BOILGATE_53 [Mycobacterium phage Boilgate]